jgi:hypothetical protein
MSINTVTVNRTTSASSLNFSATQFLSADNGQSFSNVMASFSHSSKTKTIHATNVSLREPQSAHMAKAFVTQAFATQTSIAVKTNSSTSIDPFDILNYYPSDLDPEKARDITISIQQFLKGHDFSEKTDVEAYAFIERLFIEAFGENFMMAHTLGFIPLNQNGVAKRGFHDIGSQFQAIINNFFGSEANARSVNRERLFGDMNTDEIMDTIRAQYPLVLTNRDLISMFKEMEAVGVFDNEFQGGVPEGKTGTGIKDLFQSFIHSLNWLYPNGDERSLDTHDGTTGLIDVLNKPANTTWLFGQFNLLMNTRQHVISEETINFLVNFLGANKDSDGLIESGYSPLQNEQTHDYLQSLREFLEYINSKRVNSIANLHFTLTKSLDEQQLSRLERQRELKDEETLRILDSHVIFNSLLSKEFLSIWRNARFSEDEGEII